MHCPLSAQAAEQPQFGLALGATEAVTSHSVKPARPGWLCGKASPAEPGRSGSRLPRCPARTIAAEIGLTHVWIGCMLLRRGFHQSLWMYVWIRACFCIDVHLSLCDHETNEPHVHRTKPKANALGNC